MTEHLATCCHVCGEPKKVFSNGKVAKWCGRCKNRPSRDRNCETCGVLIKARAGSGQVPSRCPECTPRKLKRLVQNDNSPTCWVCGKDRGRFADGRLKKCCNRRLPPIATRKQCPQCGNHFIQHYYASNTVFCSDECRKVIRCLRQRQLPSLHTCVCCGSLFFTAKSFATCCSPKCARHRANLRYSLRRKRITSRTVETVDPKKVFERDHYKCWICLGPCRRDFIKGDPASPTIDHITPISLGGDHSYANCATAHLTCNSQKGERI